MPFTFFAHQAPVLPLVQRRPDGWDGVALVVGTMAPDLAYVTQGWGYGPWGTPLWFDAHKLANLPLVTVAAALLAVVVRRVVLPVLPRALPDVGDLHLRDYCTIAGHRRRWWVTLGSAFVGIATHLALDAFTHPDGAAVEAVGFLRSPLFGFAGHEVRIYTLLQYGGSAVLSVLAVRSLLRLGRSRRFAPADRRMVEPLNEGARAVFWSMVAVGVLVASAYAASRRGRHVLGGTVIIGSKSTVIVAFSWMAFLGLVLACLVASGWEARAQRSPAPVDPLL